jgi:oligopeptide transport system substrate-binding protein
MPMKRISSMLALLALATLLAAGCGGDDDGGAAATGTTAGDTAADTDGAQASDQTITVNWGAEPPSLDPGLATDTTSSGILLSIMDPLVSLGEDLEPVAELAESWETSEDGLTVTFNLRDDGRWTNGDPVTAQDFEWSWKRTISPELAADYAYQFYGIKGAAEYNGCEKNCAKLRDAVGVKALDDRTLEVTLTTPQPWFVQQAAHHSFLAVHRPTIELHGDKWTEAANMVSNGPFTLESWEHNASIDLVKNEDWRDADSVTLTRVNGRMITDGVTAVQAYEAGEVDVLIGGLPPEEIPRLKETEDYQQYPGLGTYTYGFNVKNITDVNQRRAMSIAINRREIIDNVAQADQLPATGWTPQGMPGFDAIDPESPWLPENGDIEAAKALMEEVESPKRNITLLLNDSPGHREIAVAVQAAWSQLGLEVSIKQQEWAQFLEFTGPPIDPSIDVYRYGWIGDYVDAINFLELWTCESGNNSTNYCDPAYDELLEEARQTADDDARYELYGEMEDLLLGEDGAVPVTPLYWYTYVNLERPSIQDTFDVNLLQQTDLRKVVVTEE